MIAFILPLRHPSNSGDWALESQLYRNTLLSIANQTDRNFVIVPVGNPVPAAPPQVPNLHIVDLDAEPAPSQLHDVAAIDQARKHIAGIEAARDLGAKFCMFVDADDFVSKRIAGFVNSSPARSPGWYVDSGYIYSASSRFCYAQKKNFQRLCGTSVIVNLDGVDMLPLARDASDEELSRLLGTKFALHRGIADAMRQLDKPLQPVPFPGAIYHINHGLNRSGSRCYKNVYPRLQRRVDLEALALLRNYRFLGPALLREFSIQPRIPNAAYRAPIDVREADASS